VPFDWAVVPAILGELNQPDPAWWDRLTAITAPTLLAVRKTVTSPPAPPPCLAARKPSPE
jgi:hypothetical protein